MSAYNQSQYRLMLAQIGEFETGELGINSLITDLQDPFRNLQHENEAWKTTFLEHWSALEAIRSAVTFRGTRRMTAEEQTIAVKSVAALKEMVTEKIQTPIDPNSPES